MEMEIQTIKVVPFVREQIKEKKGRKYVDYEDNLTSTENKNMSCEPKILELVSDGIYDLLDMPLTFKGCGLKLRLCYLFDDLTEEEQEKYNDRSELVTIIAKNNVKKDVMMTSKKRIRERK